jgi:hypothetical protein
MPHFNGAFGRRFSLFLTVFFASVLYFYEANSADYPRTDYTPTRRVLLVEINLKKHQQEPLQKGLLCKLFFGVCAHGT